MTDDSPRLLSCRTRNPPPPSPFIHGSTTPATAAVTTAASTAFPPFCSTRDPNSAASGVLAATTPASDTASYRPSRHRLVDAIVTRSFSLHRAPVRRSGDHTGAEYRRERPDRKAVSPIVQRSGPEGASGRGVCALR